MHFLHGSYDLTNRYLSEVERIIRTRIDSSCVIVRQLIRQL